MELRCPIELEHRGRASAVAGAAAFILILIVGTSALVRSSERVDDVAFAATRLETELHGVEAAVTRALLGVGPEADVGEIWDDLAELEEAVDTIAHSPYADIELAQSSTVLIQRFTGVLNRLEARQSIGVGPTTHLLFVSVDELDEIAHRMIIELSQEATRLRRLSQAGQLAALVIGGAVALGAYGWVRKLEVVEQTVRDKDGFIAAVSHELRTPLTAVVGMAQVIQDDDDLGRDLRKELAGTIYRQSLELANLVEDLLVAARAQIGEISIVVEPFDVRASVLEAVAGVPSAEGTEIVVSDETDTDSIIGHGDPLRARQIVRNLVTNAVRYGGPSRWVTISAEGTHVEVAVVDDGPLPDFEDPEQMFEQYRHGVLKTSSGAVGIGLTVSRELADKMGGSLRYERRSGGNAFVLTIPAVNVARTQPARL